MASAAAMREQWATRDSLVASATLAGLLTEKMSLTIETGTSSPFYKSDVCVFAAFYESEKV